MFQLFLAGISFPEGKSRKSPCKATLTFTMLRQQPQQRKLEEAGGHTAKVSIAKSAHSGETGIDKYSFTQSCCQERNSSVGGYLSWTKFKFISCLRSDSLSSKGCCCSGVYNILEPNAAKLIKIHLCAWLLVCLCL